MGYRSDVKIVVKTQTNKDMLGYRAALALEFGGNEHYEDFITDMIWLDKGFTLHYEDIKWYSTCGFVDLVKRALEMVLSHKGGFCFARCGEEVDDLEFLYDSFDEEALAMYDAITQRAYTEFSEFTY